MVDAAGKKFLEAFSDSATVEQASKSLKGYVPNMLRPYANLLVSRGFLVPAGADDLSARLNR